MQDRNTGTDFLNRNLGKFTVPFCLHLKERGKKSADGTALSRIAPAGYSDRGDIRSGEEVFSPFSSRETVRYFFAPLIALSFSKSFP